MEQTTFSSTERWNGKRHECECGGRTLGYEYQIVYNRNESEPGLFESPRAAPSAPSSVLHDSRADAEVNFSSPLMRSLSPMKQASKLSKTNVQTDVEQIPTPVEFVTESDTSSFRSPFDGLAAHSDSPKVSCFLL